MIDRREIAEGDSEARARIADWKLSATRLCRLRDYRREAARRLGGAVSRPGGQLRYLFRLATDLKFLNLRRYEHAARAIDEIGRLVGGWQRLSRAAEAP